MQINIKCSDVAAIIGRNPYKTRDEVFNERINMYFGTKLKTKQVEFENALETLSEKEKSYVEDIIQRSTFDILEPITEIKSVPKVVEEYVKHEIYKNNGTQSEKKTAELCSVQEDKIRYVMPIYRNVRLVGYIDGRTVEESTIVEIKNRQRRLFGYVPDYEKIQVQCYMKLTGTHRCKFIEQYGSKMKEYFIDYDETQWLQIIKGVTEFAKDLYTYQNSEDPESPQT